MYKKITELFFRWNAYVFSNFFLKMKLTIFLLMVAFLQIRAEGFAQKVSVTAKNAPLSEVLTQIRKQIDFDFMYNNATIKDAKPITIKADNEDLRTVLDACFKDQPFEYTVKKKVIVIKMKAEKLITNIPEYLQQQYQQQQQKLTGIVKDLDTGEPLIGVSVGVEGTNQGAITDVDGKFSLNLPGTEVVLVASYIGYETRKISVSTQAEIEISLKKTDTKLNEVVVVGYGTRAKGAITGAISTVKSDVFENRPVKNSFDALQGTIPGLTITRSSGEPGKAAYGLQVRGSSSINGNVPLIIIDGVPGDINTINTNDIAEVTVLKDAAAAIDGARAADGVIIVTTKKGRKGATEVTYAGNLAFKNPTYLRKMQNTLQFAEFMDEGLRNAGIAGFAPEVFEKIKNNAPPETDKGWNYGLSSYPSFYGYTDWNKVLYKNATQQIHNIAVSGGGENSNFLVSLGYNRDNGILNFGDNTSDSYNLRLNYDFRLSKKLNVETRTNFDNRAIVTPTLLGSALTNVTRQFPYQPVYNPSGQFYGYQGYENPAQYLEEGGNQNSNLSRFATNFKIDYSILPELKIIGQAAIRLDYENTNGVNRTITRYNYAGGVQDIRNTPNSAYYGNGKTLNKLYQVYFDYNKEFGADHRINITAGASLEQTRREGQTTNGYNFISNDIFTLNLADRTKAAFANFTGYVNNQALASYFGRASYTYKNKLIADITARADGSSKFAPNERWSAVFPSAALAYIVSEEKFIKSMNTFDLLKLRVSYGKMGNQEINKLGLYDYIPLISVGGVYPIGSPNAGVPGANANPASTDRTWETIENRNVGIDVAMFNSRLTFSFDYYNKINNDMLVNIAVPAVFGATPPSTNQGKLITKGFETVVTWKDNIKDFRYSVSLQLSDSKNKLIELKNTDSYREGLNELRQGFPIYSYFGYVYDGIIKTQAQLDAYKQLQGIPARIALGDVMYKDVDGDGKLTAFGDKTKGLNGDMVYLGNLIPRYTFSSNITMGYKDLDLQVFMQGVGKRDVIYEGAFATPNNFYWGSLEYFYGKTWSPERPDARYPRYLPGGVGYDDVRSYDYRASANRVENVSYLRFKVITLGYNLPKNIVSHLMVKSARIYFSGQDLFTISKGTFGGNFDPEDGYRNEGTYPFNKVYSLGLNVKF
jgi:TonB-linked SusC/RagA family outer membrane protein